ncbi:hypothetical protein H4Q26_014834 [Puccinia striiformis f. sp. tritici PST-130]|nr:hypothetical protein H4Q26_014834 [Puccinia striiformis f. sp. tritici PST-130]
MGLLCPGGTNSSDGLQYDEKGIYRGVSYCEVLAEVPIARLTFVTTDYLVNEQEQLRSERLSRSRQVKTLEDQLGVATPPEAVGLKNLAHGPKVPEPSRGLASRLAVPSRLLESRHGGKISLRHATIESSWPKRKLPAAQELLCFGLKLKPGGLSRPELESQEPWLDVHCERGDGFDHMGHV